MDMDDIQVHPTGFIDPNDKYNRTKILFVLGTIWNSIKNLFVFKSVSKVRLSTAN